jgi:hypothetical protein
MNSSAGVKVVELEISKHPGLAAGGASVNLSVESFMFVVPQVAADVNSDTELRFNSTYFQASRLLSLVRLACSLHH